MAMVARVIQILCTGSLYRALWLHDPKYLLPFAVAQPTCGTFADLTTLYHLIDHLSRNKSRLLPFEDAVSNLLVMATLYVMIVLALMWMLRNCYFYLKARRAHEAQRRKEKAELAAAKALVAAALRNEPYI
uniref:G_PROTEIN_RECEP_F1_2 domain-containing protein n=1 Tax=Steinernema glaseri TaxID=37863 RepID=A0A1I7YUU9_9BILA